MIERLLVLRLQAEGCAATAGLNGFPLLQAAPGGGAFPTACPTTCAMSVNEFVLEGANRLSLHAQPWPLPAGRAPRLVAAPARARLQLLLTRPGRAASDEANRAVATLDWAGAAGELFPANATEQDVALPVNFPRWRWLDAEPADPQAVHDTVADFLQRLVLALHAGDPAPLLLASRVRLEETAVAYQMHVGEVADRLKARLQLLHGQQALRPLMPAAEQIELRPCAAGRLLECRFAGGPALRTPPAEDGTEHAWPLRVAVLDNDCHVFR